MKASSPRWTIQSKYSIPKKDLTPSPIHYHIQSIASKTTPQWKFGTQKKCQLIIDTNPPVGKYQTKPPQKSKALGKFGKQNIHKFSQLQTQPAPNQYNPRFNVVRKSTPHISFGKQCKPVDKSFQIPGPGAYQRVQRPHSAHKVPIGKQQRFSAREYQKNSPGPGNYEITRPSSAKTQSSFTKNVRNCTEIKHIGQPGPGHYSTSTLFDYSLLHKKGYSLGLKPEKRICQIVPGPGQYNPKVMQKEVNPSITMGHKYKEPSPQKIPGPGQYYPHWSENCPSVIMGKSKRCQLNESRQIPGPGTYNANLMKGKSPQYSLGHSRKLEKCSQIPGPGTYSPDRNVVKTRPQSAKIGNSKRGFEMKENIPGPGQYQNRRQRPSTPKYSFGKNSRIQNYNAVSPGPGQYQIPSLISNCPSYALR